MQAETPSPEVQATAEVCVLIISSTECRVETTNFQKNIAPDQERVAL